MNARTARAVLRTIVKPFLSPWVPLGVQRAWTSLGQRVPLPRAISVEPRELGGVPARCFTPPDAVPGRAILYVHGGGYVLATTNPPLAAALALAARTTTWLVDYRLAPEHPYPAAHRDVLAAFAALSAGGDRVALVGDSAGGGLALAAAVALRDAGGAVPSALALISPWVDLTLTAASHTTRAAADPLLRPSWLAWCARAYGADPRDPVASPLFADLARLPRLIIHVGEDEILLDDAVTLAERARQAGSAVELRRYPGLFHCFHVAVGRLPAAAPAIADLAAFLAV